MIKKISKAVYLILFSVTAYSQDLSYAKTVVATLASKEFQGRGYTNKGNELAGEYIISEFTTIGLLPLKKNYCQKFNISINTFPGAMAVKLDNDVLKPAVDFLVESSSPGLSGTFPVYKTSRKELNSEKKIVALLDKAKSNFIFIDETDKTGETEAETKIIDDYITFLKYNEDVASQGIILYTKEKLTWDNSLYVNFRPVIIINKPIDTKNIKTITVSIENNYIKSFETRNLAGFIKGNVKPDSFIVVVAHYDHLGQMGKDTYFPGANDNASGVAMLLSLAKYYSKHTPKYSMLFLALSGEEVGLLGAKEFTDNPLIKLGKIKFLVNFDLAGTGEEGIRVVNGSIFKDKFDILTKLNNDKKLVAKVDIRGEACNSDHCKFYEKKVPCFYIYTQGGIKAYHDIYDKSETLPLTAFVNYCILMIAFFGTF